MAAVRRGVTVPCGRPGRRRAAVALTDVRSSLSENDFLSFIPTIIDSNVVLLVFLWQGSWHPLRERSCDKSRPRTY